MHGPCFQLYARQHYSIQDFRKTSHSNLRGPASRIALLANCLFEVFQLTALVATHLQIHTLFPIHMRYMFLILFDIGDHHNVVT